MSRRTVNGSKEICDYCNEVIYDDTSRHYHGQAHHPECFDEARSPFNNTRSWDEHLELEATVERLKLSLGV